MNKLLALLLALAFSGAAPARQALLTPLPDTLSPEVRVRLAEMMADTGKPHPPKTVAEQRAEMEAVQQDIGARQLKRYGVTMREAEIAGVPVRIFSPRDERVGGPVLMNLHGGGFVTDSGSITENVPIAALTGYRVVAVRYRLAPENLFPAAVDDALAVYRALLAERPARRIGVYGTSAGAILGPELLARLRADKMPMPAALGIFSGSGDLSVIGDSGAMFGDPATFALARLYAGKRAVTDPLVSPLRGDLGGWPPALCVTSSRDFLLSATATLCRRLQEAGTPARLVMYDGLPHAFWSYIEAPESDAAFATMAAFLKQHVR